MKTPYIRILSVAGGRYVISKTDKFELTVRMENGETASATIERFKNETAGRIERDRIYFDRLNVIGQALEKQAAY